MLSHMKKEKATKKDGPWKKGGGIQWLRVSVQFET
jgi:hypothetical protein